MMEDTIVVATDLSENARAAATAACGWADAMGWKVEVFHVFDLSRQNRNRTEKVFKDDALRDQARQRVSAWYEEATGEKADEVKIEIGHPAINARARGEKDDVACLMIAMSGRGAWNRLVFGSTATKLAGRPPCTMGIAHPEHHRVRREMTLGVGVDFSETSVPALRRAAEYARWFDASLRLVYCHTLPSTTVIREGDLPEGMKRTEIVDWARDSMQEFTGEHSSVLEGLDWTSQIVTDHPVAGLRTFVEDQGIDWLFLGHRTPEQRGESTTVKGKWVQRANCSTMLVPL